jgi:predicted Ser/Thr protein kinase
MADPLPPDHPGDAVPQPTPPTGVSAAGLVVLLVEDQRQRWRRGERPTVEDYLARYPALRADAHAVQALIVSEFLLREELGEAPVVEQLLQRFPQYAAGLRQLVQLPTRAPATVVAPHEPLPAAEWVAVAGYDVLGRLGKGGMGVVYKARQLSLDRLVALKMIRYAEDAGPEEHERFRSEAQAVARLQHPHIVQVHEVGECQGLPYFSMEFCHGGSLADHLDGTPWEPQRAARLVEALARAMQAAHGAGIVHRDLKPANVLLTVDGMPKVTDFGLARRLGQQGRTQTGAILGTPSYMAPEQAGKAKEAGPPADTYALGAILYELLTGRPPFKAATDMDTMLQVMAEEPVPVRRLQPQVPKDVETICHQCLQKDPAKRYASAEALAEDLRRFGAAEPVMARRLGVLERAAKWARRRPAVAGLLGLVALVGAAGLGGVLWALGEAVRQRDLARVEAARADNKAAEARQVAAEAQRQTYFAEIGRAEAKLEAGDNLQAALVLERIGGEHRGWEYGYLRRRVEGTVLTLRGHTAEAIAVCYSPEGSRLATASEDKTVKVWDVRSGAELFSLRGHAGRVTAVCYSPDGMRLATASYDQTIKVWDARTGPRLPADQSPPGAAGADVSPQRRFAAPPRGDDDRPPGHRPSPGAYDPWAEEHERHTVLGPSWHAEELQAARKRGDAFAAEFHRRRLARGDNHRMLAWHRLAAGDASA